MTADQAHEAHRRELERLLQSKERYVNPKTTRWILREVQRTAPGTYAEDGEGETWIWSDLHLHHANIIRYCTRPFGTREEMDRALLDAWRETVGNRDTVICVGDIALTGALHGRRMTTVLSMPGRKLLVRGNHDFSRRGEPADTGSHETWATLFVPGDPELVLTHFPLEAVPAGSVNVHGHTHNNTPLREGPYINVCVEQTGYRPVRLCDVRRLGRARLADPRRRAETTAGELETLA